MIQKKGPTQSGKEIITAKQHTKKRFALRRLSSLKKHHLLYCLLYIKKISEVKKITLTNLQNKIEMKEDYFNFENMNK